MADKTPGPGHAMFGLNDQNPGSKGPEPPSPGQPGTPQFVYVQPPEPPSGASKYLPLLVGILLAVSVINLVLVILFRVQLSSTLSKHSDQLDLVTRRIDSSDERYAQLKGEFQVTTEKLGLTQQELQRARTLAANVQTQQRAAVKQLNEAIAKKASAEEVNQIQTDANAKIGGLSTDLAGTKKELESTKSEFTNALSGTKGELSGAIARTHDELVALAHRSDRDYFEFDLPRKHSRQKIGTVVMELQKTDTKRNLFTLSLLFDDKRTTRKDKAMYEPVFFYVQGAPSALELVVNKLSKDHISGYLSAPKGFFASVPNVLTSRPGTS